MNDGELDPCRQWPDTGGDHPEPISFEEYKTAVDTYRRCMELGYSLKSFRLEPVSRVYDWSVPRQAQSDALAQACEADHLADAVNRPRFSDWRVLPTAAAVGG